VVVQMPAIKLKINPEVFNDVYYPYLKKQFRYEVYYGGAGSGKSVFVAQKIVYKLLTQKMNLLVVRDTANTNRDSTFALLKQIINKWCGDKADKLFTIRESDMRIKCVNGNEVIFRGLDDPEKIKSITFTNGELSAIWVEEASEVEESSFQQLDVRLRGGKTKKTIFVTFNPIDINHWLKKRFIDNPPENCNVLKTTYKDNKFIDDEYKATLESFKFTDPYYYQVYCLNITGAIKTLLIRWNSKRVKSWTIPSYNY
jgi:phage terminase large subunit